MTQSDSSESQNPISQNTDSPSNPSINDLWKQERRKILELHRAKAEILFSTLKERLPDENLYTLQISLLVLLVPLVDSEYLRSVYVKHIATLLDIEVESGLLSKQTKQEATGTVSQALGI